MKRKLGFTLVEILIVIGLVVLLSITVLALLNSKNLIQKANSSKKKFELNTLRRTFEEYLNDKEFFPTGEDVCYDEISQSGNSCSCHICGLKNTNLFSNYMPKLICDPENPQYDYLYEFDCSSGNPSWYRICAYLPLEDKEKNLKYNYGVSSNNIDASKCFDKIASIGTNLNTPTQTQTLTITNSPSKNPTITEYPITYPTPTIVIPENTPNCNLYSGPFYCIDNNICNICGNIENCIASCNQTNPLYVNEGEPCTQMCKIN